MTLLVARFDKQNNIPYHEETCSVKEVFIWMVLERTKIFVWKWETDRLIYAVVERSLAEKKYRPHLSGAWAHDQWGCAAQCSSITAIVMWELDKCELVFCTTYWLNTLQYISTLYEMSWSEEFEMCDVYFNVIHFFNFMWHFKDHIRPQGHFPIKTKWQYFSLYKDI